MESRILTCVYCGHEYPQDTPAHGEKVLTDHIAGCEKHPMRAVVEQGVCLLRLYHGVMCVEGDHYVGVQVMRLYEREGVAGGKQA